MSSPDAERGGQVCILNLLPHAVHSGYSLGLSPFLPTPPHPTSPGKTPLPLNLVFTPHTFSFMGSVTMNEAPALHLVLFQTGGTPRLAVCH